MDPPFEHVDLAVLHRVGVHAEASPPREPIVYPMVNLAVVKKKVGEQKMRKL